MKYAYITIITNFITITKFMYGYRSAELMYALEDQINITAKDSALSEV